MGWERHQAFIIDRPVSPILWRWILFGVLSILSSVLLFILHANKYWFFLETINIWLLSFFPLAFWLLMFSVRGYFYSRALEKYELLQAEAHHAQDEWRSWGARYLAVLDSHVLLPDRITASLLVNKRIEEINNYDNVLSIDYLPYEKSLLEVAEILTESILSSLRTLPVDIPLHITVFTDASDEACTFLDSNFLGLWKSIIPAVPLPVSFRIMRNDQFSELDFRLKRAEAWSEVIIIMQFNHEGGYSDGAAIFLLSSDDTVRNYNLHGKCRWLRPMPLDKSKLSSELNDFFNIQICAIKTQGIVSDCQEINAFNTQLFPIGYRFGAPWQVENSLVLEKYMGVPGPFSGWLCAAIAFDMAELCSKSFLAISVQEPVSWISTVLPWSENEDDKPSVA